MPVSINNPPVVGEVSEEDVAFVYHEKESEILCLYVSGLLLF